MEFQFQCGLISHAPLFTTAPTLSNQLSYGNECSLEVHIISSPKPNNSLFLFTLSLNQENLKRSACNEEYNLALQ